MRGCFALLIMVAPPAFAEPKPTEFHRAVYALHEQQIAGRQIRTEQDQGDYEGAAAARYRYVDTRYYDAANGQLLSRVRRDAAAPEFVHIVEVNVYENGRLVRDFGSVTLPWAPLQPVRAYINLHHYNAGLHSFRQHDLYGEVAYEFCEGDLNGKPVRISLDGTDINASSTASPAYRACFDGMGTNWANYLAPH